MDTATDGDATTRALGQSAVESFIQHYGVVGMKWGKRRSRAEIDSHEDAKSASDVKDKVKKAKTTAVVSNKELQTAINRMNLEIQYSRLAEQTKKKSAGKKFVDKLLEDKKFRDARVDNLVKATKPILDANAAANLGSSIDRIKLD